METNFFQGPRPCAIAKGDLDMKTSFAGPRRVTALAGLFALTLTASGAAMADSYNIIFKTTRDPTTILSCATGGFTFNKTTAETFPASTASATLTGCAPPTFPTPANGSYTPGALNVVVADVVTTEPQGPNVVGLTGTLQMTTSAAGDCSGAGTNTNPKTYTINFSQSGTSGGTFNVTCSGDGTYTSATYPYYVRNTASSVPEPETLLLVLLGLGAMGWVVRKSRH
jgi:hypothetical protein